MTKPIKILTISLWSLVILLMLSVLAYGVHSSGSFPWFMQPNEFGTKQLKQLSADASSTSAVQVQAYSSEVYVKLGSGPNITASIKGTGDNRGTFDISNNGGVVSVTQRYNVAGFFNFFNFNRYIVEIDLPADYHKDLSIRLTSGNVTLSDSLTLRNVSVKQTSGDFRSGILNCSSFYKNSTSGDVNIAEISTDQFDIQETSGDMRINSLSGHGTVYATSGDMSIGLQKLNGSTSISSTSGDIILELSDKVNASLQASTRSGDVNSDFPLMSGNSDHKSASGNIGTAPYNTLNVSLLSGDITLRKTL